jgi:RND family efflux transporter MFP subunit
MKPIRSDFFQWFARTAVGIGMGIVLVAAWGCSAPEAGHDHGHGERPRLGQSVWSGEHEFFVDYEVPAAGEEVTFAVHVAALAPHVPVDSAALHGLELALVAADGQVEPVPGAAAQAGIWKGGWTAERAGAWRIRIRWGGQEVDAGLLQVYGDAERALHAEVPEAEVALSKEAAWAMPFGLGVAGPDTVYQGLPLAGTWREAPGRVVQLVAPVSGTVATYGASLLPGTAVRPGAVLFHVRPQSTDQAGIDAQWAQANEEYQVAEAAFQRLDPLVERGTATRGEWEEARLRRNLAQQALRRLEPFRPGTSGTPVAARAGGKVRTVHVQPGQWVESGDVLVTLSDGVAALLEVPVPVSALPALQRGPRAWVEESSGRWVEANWVSMGVEAASGFVSTFWEVPVASGTSGTSGASGGYAQVQLQLDAAPVACAVPQSALLEQYGSFQVAVATGGESYALRTVQVGRQAAGKAEILRGLAPGERIVTEGAYAIRMVSMAGSTPAHGHSH